MDLIAFDCVGERRGLIAGEKDVSSVTQSDLNTALDELWLRFLPTLFERVTTLESAAAAFAAYNLTGEQQEAAFAAAHKLAGVLGTFSLDRGTKLARELELLFGLARRPNRQLVARISLLTSELRELIENRRVG